MANQYDPIVIKSGLAGVLGTDTLRADLAAHAGLTTTGLAAGDVVQVTANLTLSKAVNTSTSPIIGVYDGVSGSVVREGVVVATFKSGLTLLNGDAVWLSSTAGALTNVKPTKDMLHEVGVVVHAASSKILLQQKPVISLPPSPPLSNLLSGNDYGLYQVASPSGTLLGTLGGPDNGPYFRAGIWDGNLLWWACCVRYGGSPTTVVAVDPSTRTVVAGPFTIAAYDFGYSNPNPRSMAFDGNDYWICGLEANSVYKFKSDGTVLGQVTGLGATYAGHSYGFSYDGQGYIWCHRSGGSGHEVYKIACGSPGGAPGSVTNITGTYMNMGMYGAILGGYYYWMSGDKGYPFYTPWNMYMNRVNISGTPVVTTSPWLYYSTEYCLVSDGTYLYSYDGGSGIRKHDISGWPTVTMPWYVGGWYISQNLDYDGLYLWSPQNGSSNFWRISTVDGSRSNFAPCYYGSNFATSGRVLP